MEDVKALFIFCEGPHDVAFCRLIFKYCFNIKTVKWKFSKYPSPLSQIFKQNMKNHAAQDMSLDMAHKFFLPDKTLADEKENQIVLLFNSGGKTKPENPKLFLANYLSLIDEAGTLPDDIDNIEKVINDTKYLFIYDADHEAAPTVFQNCKNSFSHIEDTHFIKENFIPLSENHLFVITENKAVYIWRNSDTKKGTLEDILIPLFSSHSKEKLDNAEKYVDESFEWEINHDQEIMKYASIAKRNKAIISSAGQGRKPGRPMSAMIDDNIFAAKKDFQENKSVQDFADFICNFAGLEKIT
ncbi:hypothetical protein QUF70_01910 [Desulfobacterales bacterium HSG17]|nr:hypothetical protein [Desulfobacterales bacterium HSG17]